MLRRGEGRAAVLCGSRGGLALLPRSQVLGSAELCLGPGGGTTETRLVSAARVGPVVYGLLLAFRGDGYG